MSDESAELLWNGYTITITRSAGLDDCVVIFIDTPIDEVEMMPDCSPRLRVRLNDEPIYEAVPHEPKPEDLL